MMTETEGRKLAKNLFLFGFEEYSTTEICDVLMLADEEYSNGDDPIFADSDYDTLKRFAQYNDPTNKYFLGVGSDVRGGKVKLPFQMGSLDQTFDSEITDWIKKWDLFGRFGVISHKLDGTSGMVIYENTGKFQIAYSRGNGVMGADISRHLSQMPSVPKQVPIKDSLVIRGENIISKANFIKAQKLLAAKGGRNYKNARNMVAGIMNSSTADPELYQFIDFVAYQIVGSNFNKDDQLIFLHNLGFKVAEYGLMLFDAMNDQSLAGFLKECKAITEYDIDGIVIEVNLAEKRAEMNPNRDTLNPAYATKYKIADADNVAIATVVDVEINISKHGYLKPRVQIVPIDLVGVTITWATGFNMKFISENKIGPGSKVRITRSGDVIPFLTSVVEPYPGDYATWLNTKIESIGQCHWSDTQVDLILNDANNNSTAKYELLVDFFDSIGAPHLGEGNLLKMFEMGFETPESVICLTQEDLNSLLGSTIMGKKIFTGLRAKLTNIPMYKLMGAHSAFGRGIGVRKCKKLYDVFEGNWTLCKSYDSILMVDGFEAKTATKIVNGFDDFLRFYAEVEHIVTIQPYEAPKEGKFTGKNVVFTGFRDSGLEKQVEDAGGKIGSSVSSKTYIVVTTDVTGKTGKLDKARTLGVQIVNIDDFKDML